MGPFDRLLSIVAALALGAGAAAGAETPPVTSFGIAFKPFDAKLSKNRRTVQITKPFPEDSPRYYRLRIKVDNPQREDWTISVRSPVGQLLTTFDQEETSCEDETGCWTVRLSSKLPSVNFATESTAVRAEIVGAVYMPEEARHPFYSPMPNSIDEKLSSMSFSSPDERTAMHGLADSLGLFIGSGNTADGLSVANWCCSGIRLTDDLFMTNWHCGAASGMRDEAYWPQGTNGNACQMGIVDMSWDDDDLGREFSCEKVEYTSKALDVAVLRLGTLADGLELSRPLRQPIVSEDPIRSGDEVMILHHPACKPKSVTRGCTVLKAGIRSWTGTDADEPKTEFTHNCTTEAGSSGGPVFSSALKMIGIHHLGVDSTRDEPGNFAVGLSFILDEIKRGKPDIYGEITGQAP